MAYENKKLQDVKPFDNQKVSIVSSDTEYLIPAWCKNVIDFNNEEYVQFEVKEKDIWDTDSDIIHLDDADGGTCLGDHLNVEKTFCHLCNIQIPLPYINEHLESSKHLTHRKIAEISMERIKNQMMQNYYKKSPPPSIYFCSTCVVMVAEIDKRQHLKSKSHKNALILDKIMNDFLKIYTNYETETNDETELEIVPSRDDVDKNATTKLAVDVKNNNNVEHKNFNACNYENSLTNNKIITPVESDDGKRARTFANLEDYINYLNANTSTCKLEYLDGFYLSIKTDDNVFLKVKHENYHGLVALGKHHVQCKLCTIISRDTKEHMLSPEHLQKVLLPINNHCIRKLDIKKTHCVLCNDLIDDPDVHTLFNKTHDRMLMNALSFDADEKETDKTQSKASDDVKNTYNKTGALPKTTAETRVKVEAGKAVKESKSKGVFWGLGTDDWVNRYLDIHYLLEHISENQLKCKVCNITFPIDRIEQHLTDQKHSQTYDALIVANGLKKLKKKTRCQICNTNVLHGNELEHINSATHMNSLSIIKVKTTQSLIDSTGLLLGDNKANDTFSGNNNHDKHDEISNTEQSVTPEEKDKFKENDNQASCAAGSAFSNAVGNTFGNSIANTADYVTGNAADNAVGNAADVLQTYENIDSIWFDNVPRKPNAKNKNNAVVINKSNDHKHIESSGYNGIDNTGENDLNSKLGTNSCKKVCKVCSIIIPDEWMDETEHVNEGYHKNYINIIERNRLRLVGNMYVCEFCHDCIPIGQHFHHIHEQTHVQYTKTLTNNNPDAVGEIDNTKFNGDYSIIASVPPRKYPYYEMMNVQKTGKYKCLVCSLNVPKNAFVVKSHVEEKKHKILLQEILTGNLIMEKDDHFNCCVCCARLPKENLFDHINNGQHKIVLMTALRLKQRLKGTLVCYLCNEVTSPEHRQSVQHQTNTKLMESNRIVITDDICFCKACNIYFICKYIDKHISMQEHLINVV